MNARRRGTKRAGTARGGEPRAAQTVNEGFATQEAQEK
jgi:hypothetical protein